MKNRFFLFLCAWLMTYAYANAQPPAFTTSPADGSADVWYYIKFAEREWPLTAVSTNSRYLYDQGDGKSLVVTQPLAGAPDNLQWKIEETGVDGRYRIVSKLGNGIEYTTDALILEEFILGDRFYTSATSTQLFSIPVNRTNFWQLRMLDEDGTDTNDSMDKSNYCTEFGIWRNDVGNSVLFEPVATTDLTPSDAPVWTVYAGSSSSPTALLTSSTLTTDVVERISSTEAGRANLVAYNIPNATITATFSGEGADMFSLTKTDFTAGSDGVLAVHFNILLTPPEGTLPGIYQATLTFTSSVDDQAVEVELTGNVLDFPVKLSSMDDTEEYWYYAVSPRRYPVGNVLTDTTTTEEAVGKLIQATAVQGNDAQLWKVVREDAGRYLFVNKASGKQIDYNVIGGNNFSVGPTSTRTFSFVKWTGARDLDYWCIMCNGQGQLNKENNNPTFTSYSVSNDEGNAFRFVSADDPELNVILAWDTPALSAGEVENWYRIFVPRRNQVAQENEFEEMIIQGEMQSITSQYWKFTETALPDTFKIESFAGYEMTFDNDAERYFSQAQGEGTLFTFLHHPNKTHWMLRDIDGSTFFNDNGGTAFGRYSSASDVGSTFIFYKAPSEFTVESLALDFDETLAGETQNLTVDVFTFNAPAAYEITGDDAAAFELDDATTAWHLSRGGTIGVNFIPVASGNFSAILAITANGETVEVALTGTAYKPEITADPAALTFGTVAIGEASPAQTVTVAVVDQDGDIAYTLAGDDAAAFEIDATEFTAAAGGVLSVVFKPEEEKDYSATIELTSLNAEPISVALTGTGEFLNSIPAIHTGDPVILVKYYTLLGVAVQKPVHNSIYLVKKVYASQKVEIVKELYLIKQ